MNTKFRHIKSFVLRQGKMTIGQKNAIEQLLPLHGIEYTPNLIDFAETFSNHNPVIIEIGFGMGTATWQIASQHPDINYIGIEVHGPGVGTLLMQIKEHNISNLKIAQHDAIEVIKMMVPDNAIAGFHIFFPDPWPKKRHHKRRIVQTKFIQLLTQKLTTNGYIHLATDWQEYAQWMMDILSQNGELKNSVTNEHFAQTQNLRPITKFEQRGINLGHGIWDLIFIKA